MDVLFIIGVIFIYSCILFTAGYLVAAREFGKDVRFYKDLISNQRTTIDGYRKKIVLMQWALGEDR